ncbi:hypothetical protein [Rariglobus hedericola]|uniref:Uncharacterized protein n=1 Tax=Rariglobus hedericola TaxID=2597822 RepID=A0A556QSA9_9BACT|nr:hypothetical protein [Rariglobus hedericola]TSJ79525.1 hypothetical protein FPL22_09635 [Rariglobus hedericola]
MKPRPQSVRLHLCLAGIVAAGVLAAGLMVARPSSPNEAPVVVRSLPLASSRIAQAETAPRIAFLDLKSQVVSEADRYRCGILFRQWADRDFAAALECADRQPAGPWREEMFGWLALVVARLNPAEAATMADRDMKPGLVRNETVISILHLWARTDLARATTWADSFPPGAFRDRALDEVAGFMSDVPPERSPN